jgi:rhamnulokinase
MAKRRLAAVDLGAQSGRVGVAGFDGERVDLEIVHRFPNRPLWLPDGLHWNIGEIFAEILAGLSEVGAGGPLDGVGIDTWGCDYALLDAGGRMLGLPFHYRDPKRSSQPVLDAAFARASAHELYAHSGIQVMAINTVFQLVAEPRTVAGAERIALIPDLLAMWLTGALANELTAASTTGLLSAHSQSWDRELVGALGLPAAPFTTPTTPPGTDLGPILSGHAAAGRAVGTRVRTVASHDTASAFAAAPMGGPQHAILSSGTWSLLGIHTPRPHLDAKAERYNLTNERAFDDSTRLLKNVMGMWLVEECRREWGGVDYERLYVDAAAVTGEVPLFDPDDDSLLSPGPMVERIIRLCGEPGLGDRARLIRAVLTSLACKYRLVLERLEYVTGQRIEVIQVVGGAVRNPLLCRLTANLTGRPVLAGAAEATLLGNALVQLLAVGELGDADQLRAVAARSVPAQRYEPEPDGEGEATYARFLAATGLSAPRVRAHA